MRSDSSSSHAWVISISRPSCSIARTRQVPAAAATSMPRRGCRGRSRLRLLPGEAPHFGHDLVDGANVRQGVEGDRDIEVVFQFADELEDLEGVEAEVGQQLTPRSRINFAPAQPLENLNRIAFKPIKGNADSAPGAAPPRAGSDVWARPENVPRTPSSRQPKRRPPGSPNPLRTS